LKYDQQTISLMISASRHICKKKCKYIFVSSANYRAVLCFARMKSLFPETEKLRPSAFAVT